MIEFGLLTLSVGGLWLAYNQANYGNPLEWANGPYSARAIQERSRTATYPSYPGENSPRTAALYFLKVSRLNVADGRSEKILFSLAFAGSGTLFFVRRAWPLALLWTAGHVLCCVHCLGERAVYVPQWYPFGYYNVRYGLQLLPAIAVFARCLPGTLATLYLPSEQDLRLWASLRHGVTYPSGRERPSVCVRRRSMGQPGWPSTVNWVKNWHDCPSPRD